MLKSLGADPHRRRVRPTVSDELNNEKLMNLCMRIHMDPVLKRMSVLIPILCFVALLSTEGKVSGHAHVWIHVAVIVQFDQKGLLPLALAVGMVPCPGVVIIMLFALSANLLATGLMMSLVMALGMAATISSAGVLTVLGMEGLLRGLSRKERAQHMVQKSLSLLGSLLIIAFGAMLLSTVI